MTAYAIGFDLGGSVLKSVVVDPAGAVLHRARHMTLAGTVASSPCACPPWAEKAQQLVAEYEKRQGAPTAAIGVAAPGLAAADGRSIACMPGRLEGLERLDWTALFEREQPVPVLNDAHAALLGEAWLGAGRGCQDLILLTLGTGVGGAILAGGKLLRGSSGRAGHLGHITLDGHGPRDITGMPGSLEDAIGECTLPARSGGQFHTTHALVTAHLAGDAAATACLLESVRGLACGIAALINVVDPEAVIIGGGIAQAGPALFAPLERYLREVEWNPLGRPTPLLPAALGEYAGAIGAARAGMGAIA
jgi:glucokinase